MKNSIIRPLRKKLTAYFMKYKHKKLLKRLKGKKEIKVVFFVNYRSMWKADTLFKKMLQSSIFRPIILVCPDNNYGEERMFADLRNTYDYFKAKGYPLLSSYNEESKSWVKLKELAPDIIFFNRPNKSTIPEYHKHAYSNYLSCYIPYHHEAENLEDQYNTEFHAAMWKIFTSHEAPFQLHKKLSPRKGENTHITGYSVMEEVLEKIKTGHYSNPWKNNDGRLKIIWAPHHSVNAGKSSWSNFVIYADLFVELAKKHCDNVIWSFKPHPLLRPKLYKLPDWGKERTDNYYRFWEENEFTQFDDGEYIDLFLSSNALIHDSGSFLIEYLYLKKPVQYLISKSVGNKFQNPLALEALKTLSLAHDFKEIEQFVEELIQTNGFNKHLSRYEDFYDKHINPFFKEGSTPSDTMLKILTREIST
jgi:hypothetical protein